MKRQGIVCLGAVDLLTPMELKKYLLLFDHLIIDAKSFAIAKDLIYILNRVKPLNLAHLPFNLQNIEYLQNIKLLQLREINESDVKSEEFKSLSEDSAGFVEKTLKQMAKLTEKVKKIGTYNHVSESIMEIMYSLPPYMARMHALVDNLGTNESCPILSSYESHSATGKKESVINFILQKIPEIDENEPWEKIFDFRSDTDSQRKFYALIKWINEIYKKDFTNKELEDEFLYLYHEYVHQFKLHKLKYTQGVLEIVVTAGIDFLSGQTGNIVQSSLFNISRRQIQLLEEEAKLPGREVAYIVKASNELKR